MKINQFSKLFRILDLEFKLKQIKYRYIESHEIMLTDPIFCKENWRIRHFNLFYFVNVSSAR